MERDFKQEFIELKQNEIPDLWNRIEAGLSEKEVTASVPEKAESSFKKINWRRWGTLAAACLCVAIIIPAIALRTGNDSSPSYSGGQSDGNMSNSAPMYYGVEDYATSDEPEMNGSDSDGASASADTSGIYYEYEAATGMADDWDNSDAGAHGDMEMSQESNNAETPSETENTSETTETDKDVQAENSETIKELDLQDGQKIEGVLVQIVDTEFIEFSGEEIIYQAIVLEPDADAVLTKNMQIEIVYVFDMEHDSLSMIKNKFMKERESYEVTLCFEQDRLVVINASKADK
ncbi:MAG: hypothetical protein K2K21_09035 [Lachnospiraceae bacterium]|nr:hypothetical protein [Lachnospiraceae bacterium]